METETYRPAFPDIPENVRPPISALTFIPSITSLTMLTLVVLSYGLSFEQSCRKHVVETLKCHRAYIIASTTLAAKTDNLQKLESALSGHHSGTWKGIPQHTPYESLVPILQDIREKQADCIVTLGGGSITDGAKFITYALANDVHSLEDILRVETDFLNISLDAVKAGGTGKDKTPEIPLIFIPTTLSGGEYSKFAACTNPDDKKVVFNHPGMYARVVILDGAVSLTVPVPFWLSTGVRSIDHCVETLCSVQPQPVADMASEKGLLRLVTSLLRIKEDPNDSSARLESLLGGSESMTGLNLYVPVGGSHGISHCLGPLGVSHGETSCLLLPAVMRYNFLASKSGDSNAQRQERIKQLLWQDGNVGSTLEKEGLSKQESDLADALRAIFNALGMISNLKQTQVQRHQWDQVAEHSLQNIWVKANPLPLTEKGQIIKILELCSGEP